MLSKVSNILIVDDEKAVAASIKAALKGMGHAADVIHDGGDALTRITKSPGHYDILITDHLMRTVSGLEFLIQLPVNTFKGKIIVLSAYLTPELESKYRALGVGTMIRKPFDVDELRKAVGASQPPPEK